MRPPQWLSTVRARIALTVAVAVLGSTVATTVVAYEMERSDRQDQFRAAAVLDTASDVVALGPLVKAEPTAAAGAAAVRKVLARRTVERDLNLNIALSGYNIIEPDLTQTRVCPIDRCTYPVPAMLRRSVGHDFSQFYWTDDRRLLVVAGSLDSTSTEHLTLVEYFDYSAIQKQLTRLRNDLLPLDAAGLIVAVVLGLAVSTGISRPIRRTAQAAHRLGTGDLDTRIPVQGSGELAELAVNFNAMAQRLSTTLHDLRLSQTLQQRFVADVSHELRTPLAAMVAVGDGLDSTDPALRTRAVALVREQTRRMAGMVDDLLEVSRFDAGQVSLDLESVDLAELARDVVRTVAPDADVRVTALGDVTADVDAPRVHTILRNLIVNAVQHGAPPVDVVVDGRSDPLVVTVADEGPGVAGELVDTVFDRFVRADTARTRVGGAGHAGTGLGLAIAAENAHLHGATLQVVRGARSALTLHLPRGGSAAR